MLCQGRSVSQDDQLHAGTGDRDVHTTKIVQETDISLIIGTDQADHDHIAFLSLEAVHRVYGDQSPERFEKEFRLIRLRIYCTCDL